MRNKKALAAGALMVPALALTGGIAYASTTTSDPAPTRTAVTATVQAHGQHPAGQARHDRCDWRCGDHRGDWRGHGYQRHATQHHATQHHSHQTSADYQGGWGHWGGGDHHGDRCDW
jgi:hypothetical protein